MHLCECMYVCIYVCVSVCMHVCVCIYMYVCKYVCMHVAMGSTIQHLHIKYNSACHLMERPGTIWVFRGARTSTQ